MNIFGYNMVLFNKVECLNDLYVTKNMYTSKHEFEREFFYPLLTTNILLMASDDPEYRPKRKALASAFFKDKVKKMIIDTKDTTMRIFKHYQDKGETTEEDLVRVTTKLQNHLITNLMLGDNASFKTLPYLGDDDKVIQVEMADYLDMVLSSFAKRIGDNLLTFLFPSLLRYQITATDRRLFTNSRNVRNAIGDIVKQKKESLDKAITEGKPIATDVITIALTDDHYAKKP